MSDHTTPVLLDGLRTPFGKYKGALSGYSARDLNAIVIKALLAKVPELMQSDGVLLGQVLQATQGQNPARLAASDAGLPLTIPAATFNSVCLAGLSTVADATRRIHLGEGRAYIVGGGDSMSRAPHAALMRTGIVRPGSLEMIDVMIRDGLWCSISNEGVGEISERANRELRVSREAQDEIAVRSHQLAAQAYQQGLFGTEVISVQLKNEAFSSDEGVRGESSLDKVSKLLPAFNEFGTITAGNASQMSDGASIGAVTSLAFAKEIGRAPLAKIISFAEVAGPDTSLHLKPVYAIELALKKAGLKVSDIDLFEINEAFAAVVATTCTHLKVPLDITNVNGGAIAIGHPLGGTGFRLLLTLAKELQRRNARYGVASMCGGGGQGFAVIIERI